MLLIVIEIVVSIKLIIDGHATPIMQNLFKFNCCLIKIQTL